MLAVILAWVFAAAITVIVLGFCAYELSWKFRRLRTDADKLRSTVAQLGELQTQLGHLQQRTAELNVQARTAAKS